MEKSELGQILIFGNNAEFITSLCDILTKSGYRAFSCTLWENALEALKAHDFDLFLIDVSIPDMDGIALLRGAMTINANLMSIIITDQNSIQNSVRTMRINVFDYILKPFNVEELLTKISKAIEVSRLWKTEGMYRSIFENAVEGIYLMTKEERYLIANHVLAKILGYESPDELITDLNKTGNQLYVKPDHRPKVLSLTQKIDVVSGLESQVFRKDGSKVWISENVCAVRDTDGHLLYFRGTVEDITRQKQAMEELFETETYLRQCAENAEKNKEMFLDIIDEVHDSYKQLENLFINFVKAIVSACEERRPWNKGHSQRVASYSLKIAKGMGLSNDEKEKIRLAALLHDIGQILYDKLVDKPEKLTNEEFEVIKKHPLLGVTILQRVKQLKDIIPIIRHHHERIDGKGYPDGLKGEEIPVGARILHVADSFESMTADRPYRTAQGKEYAYLELKRCNNTQFDPRIAEVALKVL